MKDKILHKLSEIENAKGVEILFAIESGSRAWGFASPDSDYDIRFIYRHPKDWYLDLWESKDVIEFMTEDDLDGSGWDLRKALRLLAKSNASFTGWLFSPIVYRQNDAFAKEIKELAKANFNPIAGFHHFHSMNKNFIEKVDEESMRLKTYFYALRTVLCAHWIAKNQTIPPVKFVELFPLIDAGFHTPILDLIEVKSSLNESESFKINDDLLSLVKEIYIENERLKSSLDTIKPNYADFNAFFNKNIL